MLNRREPPPADHSPSRGVSSFLRNRAGNTKHFVGSRRQIWEPSRRDRIALKTKEVRIVTVVLFRLGLMAGAAFAAAGQEAGTTPEFEAGSIRLE